MELGRWLPPAVWAVPAIMLCDDRAPGMEQLRRSDSKESGTGAAIQNTLPHPLTPSTWQSVTFTSGHLGQLRAPLKLNCFAMSAASLELGWLNLQPRKIYMAASAPEACSGVLGLRDCLALGT